MKVFISYSHPDEPALVELHKHLSVLRRNGEISTWYDRNILAGGELDQEIFENLESSDLFLALISHDFIASDYCYEREMDRALELHREGRIRIVSVIVEPFDWPSTPLSKFKALPKDGLAVSQWTNPNEAFLDITNEIRKLLTGQPANLTSDPSRVDKASKSKPRFKVKKTFNEIDYNEFRSLTFEECRSRFERGVNELNREAEGVRASYEIINAKSFTCTIVNQLSENQTNHMTVHSKSGSTGLGDLFYSFDYHSPPDRANGWFYIDHTDFELVLRQSSYFESGEETVNPREAAEQIWKIFLDQAGVSNE